MSDPTAVPPVRPPRIDPAPPLRRGWIALAGICLGFLVVLFDATAVTVATGALTASLHASVTEVTWVLNAYTVGFAAFMVTAGSLGDRWGARRVYLGGSALFAVASAVCAAAPDGPVLIAARAVQGVGAAAVVPCSLALIAHRFTDGAARSRALGIWGGTSGLGLIAGPVVGGGLVSAVGWRAVFLVVVPIAVISMVIVATRIEETPALISARFDRVGQVLAVLALLAVTSALSQTHSWGWTDERTLGLLGAGLLAGGGFVLVERRVAHPMLPPTLFADPRFRGATGVGLLFNFGLYGALLCLTLTLEQTARVSAATAGAALVPLAVTVSACALLSGPLATRFGPRVPMVTGLAGGLVGAGLLAGFGDRVGVGGIAGLGAVLGLVGLAMPAMTGVALAAAGPARAGLGAAVLNAARQSGGALGVALLGSAAFAGPGPSGFDPDGPDGPRLLVPMALAAAGYLVAVVVTILTIHHPTRDGHTQERLEERGQVRR